MLIISPVTADALTPVVKQAMDAGIQVVTLDRKVNTAVTLHIGADNVLIGKTAGEFVCETLGGEGSVIEIQGTAGASATVDRHDAFHAVLAEKCPNVKVVADQVGELRARAGDEIHGRHAAALPAGRDRPRLRPQ